MTDQSSQAGYHEVIAAIATSSVVAPSLAVLALREVRRGVVTGEGPTTAGRIHFSRTIDAQDAALCQRILIAAGGEAGIPVTQEEAEVLFEIHDAARDREDEGRFDDLFVKAIAHYALSAVGRPVPPRALALAPETPIQTWATREDLAEVGGKVGIWLNQQIASNRRVAAVQMLHALLVGAVATPVAMSLASVIDLAA
jgi:hypothetical protein